MEWVWLSGFALLAGFVDSVVGGGGLIQIPALLLLLPGPLAAQIPAVLGTNKLSSICGTGMALWQYTRRIPIHWSTLLPSAVAAFGFSYLGARTLSALPREALRPIILVLLVGVMVYTWVQRGLGERHAPRHAPAWERRWGMVVGVVIGFYDGFFGPGTGSFLMFLFIGWFGFDFLTATASAKVINFATNLSALGYFAATDNIYYGYGVAMAVSNVVGSVLGTRMAMLKGNRFVRRFFLLVAAAMVLRFGYDVVAPWWRGR